MIKAVTGLFIFAVALCAYIVVSPSETPIEPVAALVSSDADVTRAQTEAVRPGPVVTVSDTTAAPTPEATDPDVVAEILADIAQSAPDGVVTDAPVVENGVVSPAEMPAMSPPMARPATISAPALPPVAEITPEAMVPVTITAAPLDPPQIQTDQNTISDTTTGILAGLGLEIRTPTPVSQRRSGADTVLAEIGAITGTGAPAPTPEPVVARPAADTALERLIVASLKEGRTDDEIDAMVNAAAIAGDLTVPEVLVTSDGRIDTAVLLQSIIVQATIAAGGTGPEIPSSPSGQGVEVRVVKRAAETEQFRFYTVNEGDSLGAIAVKFYGNVDKFKVIFDANRDILTSPNNIRIGQRLVIPDLPLL